MELDHFQKIYTLHAGLYHRLIAAEDYRSMLPAALKSVTSFQGKRVLDLGSGTGRIPLLFAGEAAEIVAVDTAVAMLRENRSQRQAVGGRWHVVQADMRSVPLPSAWADITTTGWAIGHMRSWFNAHWKEEIARVLAEILRLTRPGGYAMIIETLGTGSRVPRAPTRELSEYYDWLEDEWGFSPQEVRTDYEFDSVEQAVELTGFFFGPDLAAQIRENNWTRLQEWTGVWVRRMER